ncbi:reverse transcriptase domain-containing protein [Tanacetum coccineum]
MCPHIQEIQGTCHIIAAAETHKVATKVLTPGKHKLLPRNIIAKEHPRKEQKHCHKVKAAHEDIGSQNQKSKSRALRTTCPNHGVWFDDLSQESIDSYDDLRKSFLENYLQQKKCIKDPVEIHNIKQRDWESTEEFVRRYKLKCRDVKGASECMKIFEFMHEITNPELIKRLHDNIPKSVDEMMRVTTTFLRGEVVASNREWKKSFPSWKQQEAGQKQNFKKESFRNQQRTERKQDKFTLLTKTQKEILALDKGKFKPPPPMTTPVEKRNASKLCEFHGEVGHTTNECMHLKRQIEEMLKAGKLSHLIKELKQNNEKDQTKTTKKRETLGKDKPLAILMIQPWQRITRQRITQTFSPESEISFPPLGERDRTEGPKIIEAKMGGHCVHRMYVDGVSSSEILYEHCFNRFHPENSYIAERQDHPTRVHDGFRTRGAAASKHRLNIREGCLPVRQKKRGQAPERNKAICEEIEKLVDANIMKEVHYHSWLSNLVMVKKHDGSWRMCVDSKDLNKVCPKDGYSLPEIDWKLEFLCGYPFKCFLDAYKGYHQIKMAEEDEEKMAFITSQGIFCYSKMPFRLKNTRATYQRLVDKAFQK